MLVDILIFSHDSLISCNTYFLKNKASLTRKINSLRRYISGSGFDTYGPLYCHVYIYNRPYCTILYNDHTVSGCEVLYD